MESSFWHRKSYRSRRSNDIANRNARKYSSHLAETSDERGELTVKIEGVCFAHKMKVACGCD